MVDIDMDFENERGLNIEKKSIGDLLIESGEVVESLSNGWHKISPRAYRNVHRDGCEGAKIKDIFEEYGLQSNCIECPYINSKD